MTRRIALYHEVFASIRGSKHWGNGELVLQSLETFLTFVGPLELDAFVEQVGQGLGNLGEVLDEAAAITSQPEETSDLLDILCWSPIKNSLNSFWVDGYAILGNDMTEIGDFGQPEFTLAILGIELVLSQLLQYKTKVFCVLFFALGIYQDKPRRTCRGIP